MTIHLDHTIVPTRHRNRSARRLAELLGVEWGPSPAAPVFTAVYVNDGLTLDFIDTEEAFPVYHFCFRVCDAEFDAIAARLVAAGIGYRSGVRGPMNQRISTDYGGRGIYWNEPDGHQWEVLTASYARPSLPALPGTAEREFVHARLIDAPRERVFRAFADPLHLARWWGPAGFGNTFQQFDLRPGGAWRFVMHAPDGTDHPNQSVFAQVVAPERIVFDHRSGHHFQMTLTFTAVGSRTMVGWRQVFDTAEERARMAPFVLEANEQNLDRLAAEVCNVA